MAGAAGRYHDNFDLILVANTNLELWQQLQGQGVLRFLHRLHREDRGSHATIDLVPALENPKDLFALLGPRQAKGRPVQRLSVPA